MQDADLDPWSCAPCTMPTSIKLPTLKDLYGWKEACAHCDKAGVYATSVAKQRPDQYIPPLPPLSPVLPNAGPTSLYNPAAPMPRTPPRSILLASCVPEPPEDEVLEWLPTEPMGKSVSVVSHVGESLPEIDKATALSGVALEGLEVKLPPEHDQATSFNDVAHPEDDAAFSRPVCLDSRQLLEDSCPVCDG